MPLSKVKHVIHLEHELLISMDIAHILLEAGVTKVHHYSSAMEALAALDAMHFDAAILDQDPDEGPLGHLAARLLGLGIPYMVYAANKTDSLEDPQVPRLIKPAAPLESSRLSGPLINLPCWQLKPRQTSRPPLTSPLCLSPCAVFIRWSSPGSSLGHTTRSSAPNVLRQPRMAGIAKSGVHFLHPT